MTRFYIRFDEVLFNRCEMFLHSREIIIVSLNANSRSVKQFGGNGHIFFARGNGPPRSGYGSSHQKLPDRIQLLPDVFRGLTDAIQKHGSPIRPTLLRLCNFPWTCFQIMRQQRDRGRRRSKPESSLRQLRQQNQTGGRHACSPTSINPRSAHSYVSGFTCAIAFSHGGIIVIG